MFVQRLWLWQQFIDWYFYQSINRNYPEPGMMCEFGSAHLECIVVSNQRKNRAIVLRVENAEWFGAYIIISFCCIGVAWPTCTMGIIDDAESGLITRGYVLERQEMSCTPTGRPPATSVCRALEQFDSMVTSSKAQWFLSPQSFLSIPDWRMKVANIESSVRCIQAQWRKSISSPSYKLCISRLSQEFRDLGSVC